ncbi:flagellar biosynthetic protein FliO, partial [Massilia sp. AB1]|uniref:flagellar biosynthetic protein FliO n=1 Tax=Massilia sp. AB1 TaxID=2823371 RepID=UPI0027D968A8
APPGYRRLPAWPATPPTLRALAAAMLFAPLAACAAPLPAEPAAQAAPAVEQPAPAPAPATPAPETPAAPAPAPAAQEPATTPRRPGETTTGRPPAPARPAPSLTTTNTAPVPAPLPADQAPAPAAQAPITAPAPAPEQQTPRAALPSSPTSPAAGSLMQTILALVLVLAVLAGLAWFLKRFAPKMMGGSNANLRLVGALNLGARERIVVVEVGNQWIVVGASPGRINALATMPRQEGVEGTATVAAATPSAGSFSDWLKNTIDKRNAK